MRPVALITWALAGTCTFAPTAVILPALITTVPFGMSAPLTVTTVPPRIANVPCGPGFGLNEPSCACAETARVRPLAAASHVDRTAVRFIAYLTCSSSRDHRTAAAVGGFERRALLRHLIALR